MKQVSRAWYVCIDSHLVKLGRCAYPNLYFKSGPRYYFDFGYIYIDGLLLTGNDILVIRVRGRWPLKFEMNNIVMLNYFLRFGK